MCDRLDCHFIRRPLGVAALMIVVLLYVVDRFLAAVGRAETELSDAKLAFGAHTMTVLSSEQHAIACMDALSKMQQEKCALHHLLAARGHCRWLPPAKLIVSVFLLGGAVLFGRSMS